MMKFYDAWYFIQGHPNFQLDGIELFPYGVDISVVKVNPETMEIDNDDTKNTKLQVWLEYGPYGQRHSDEAGVGQPTHDIRLDCGADTFESAIIALAELIKQHYGDYEPQEA